MRVIALDIGRKRIGVAISDELGITAQGLKVIDYSNEENLLEEIKDIIEEYNVEEIVIGNPIKLNGRESRFSCEIKLLSEKIKKCFNIPVFLQDERLSTKEAERFLISCNVSRKKRKRVIDKTAAVLLLQTYLNKKLNTKKNKI